MDQERPIFDLTDRHAIAANAQGDITPGQRQAITHFLSTALQTAIVGALTRRSHRPWSVRYLHRIKHALDRGEIATIAVSVASDGQLRAVDSATPLPLLRFPTWSGAAIPLRSGPYRLYYLPGVDFVVAVETLDPTAPLAIARVAVAEDEATLALRTALSRANGFDPFSLLTNRAGKLSASQRQQLLTTAGHRRVTMLVAAAACVLMSGAMLYHALSPGLATGTSLWFGAFGLIACAAGIQLFRRNDAYGEAVRVGRIVAIEGYGTRTTSRTSNPVRFGYHIGVQHFFVSKAAYDAFTDQRIYRAYYLPIIDQLVNIEPLPATITVTQAARIPELRLQTVG